MADLRVYYERIFNGLDIKQVIRVIIDSFGDDNPHDLSSKFDVNLIRDVFTFNFNDVYEYLCAHKPYKIIEYLHKVVRLNLNQIQLHAILKRNESLGCEIYIKYYIHRIEDSPLREFETFCMYWEIAHYIYINYAPRLYGLNFTDCLRTLLEYPNNITAIVYLVDLSIKTNRGIHINRLIEYTHGIPESLRVVDLIKSLIKMKTVVG